MKWLKLSALASLFSGLILVIQGCSEREGALLAIILLMLNFCNGPEEMMPDDPGDEPLVPLIAEWKFDEGSGTTAIDTTGNGHDGTLQNGATYGGGVSSTALLLDGQNDHVVVPDDPELDLTVFTIEGWFKYNEIRPPSDGNQGIINKYRTDVFSEGGYEVKVGEGNGFLDAQFKDTSANIAGAAAPTNLGEWQHFAVTYDGVTTDVYINGLLSKSETNAVTILPNEWDLLVGALRDLSGTIHRFFGGWLDELRIYDGVLSATAILARCELHNPPEVLCGVPLVPVRELAAEWKLDEGSGPTAMDTSANSNDGTISGATFTPGVSGTALLFDGIDDYVGVTDDATLDFGTGSFSISAWARTSVDDTSIAVISTNWATSTSITMRFINGFVDFIANSSNVGIG